MIVSPRPKAVSEELGDLHTILVKAYRETSAVWDQVIPEGPAEERLRGVKDQLRKLTWIVEDMVLDQRREEGTL